MTRTAVGTATLAFSDAGNGSIAYTVDGATGQKAITRQLFAEPANPCVIHRSAEGVRSRQDLYWQPSESGWGLSIAHQGDILFGIWFTYDAGGRPAWYVMPRMMRAGSMYTGDLYRTRGPAFDAAPWDPALVSVTKAGTASFTFSYDNEMYLTFGYTLDGVSRTRVVERQVFSAPASSCPA